MGRATKRRSTKQGCMGHGVYVPFLHITGLPALFCRGPLGPAFCLLPMDQWYCVAAPKAVLQQRYEERKVYMICCNLTLRIISFFASLCEFVELTWKNVVDTFTISFLFQSFHATSLRLIVPPASHLASLTYLIARNLDQYSSLNFNFKETFLFDSENNNFVVLIVLCCKFCFHEEFF